MAGDLDDIRSRLDGIAEELADKVLDRLHEAVASTDDGDRVRLAAEERRLTRARRAVEKASALLSED